MKKKNVIVLSLMTLSIALLVPIGILMFRIPMQKIPQEFEGIYSVRIHKKERSQYNIHIRNTNNFPEAVVYCGNHLSDMSKVGVYPLNVKRSMTFLTPNLGWLTTQSSLKVEFPHSDGILDLWIGEGRDTHLVRVRDEACIEGIYPIEYLLTSTGQSIHDPSHKGNIIARRSDDFLKRLQNQ